MYLQSFPRELAESPLPERVLLVDDDELELALMADRVAAAGFEVSVARNGVEALTLLAQQWYPVMITDWHMPVMDGIELTEAVREQKSSDMHIMMLTVRGDSLDYERGYGSGVDNYLTKKLPDAELLARIHSAFRTLALRRSVDAAQEALRHASDFEPHSGALTTAALETTLTREILRARRYRRQLALVTFGAKPHAMGAPQTPLPADVLRELVTTITSGLRTCADRMGRLQASGEAVFAVVLPETGLVEVRAVGERLETLLDRWRQGHAGALSFSCGLAALEDEADREAASAATFIQAAERCRRLTGTL